MITHEDFELALDGYIGLVEVVFPKNSRVHSLKIETMKNYAKQQEQLVKDVARFLELDSMLSLQGFHSKEETEEYQELRYKLSKGGKQDE